MKRRHFVFAGGHAARRYRADAGAGARPGRKTITGGFDVGPGGFPGNFNPFAATAGFTWLSAYYEPLVTNSAELGKLENVLASDYRSAMTA